MSIDRSHHVDPTQGPAEERVGLVISWALGVAAVVAIVGIVAQDDVGTIFSAIAVGVVTAIPILRVGWLVKRWFGQRDQRFAWIAVFLLVLIAIGPIVGFLQR